MSSWVKSRAGHVKFSVPLVVLLSKTSQKLIKLGLAVVVHVCLVGELFLWPPCFCTACFLLSSTKTLLLSIFCYVIHFSKGNTTPKFAPLLKKSIACLCLLSLLTWSARRKPISCATGNFGKCRNMNEVEGKAKNIYKKPYSIHWAFYNWAPLGSFPDEIGNLDVSHCEHLLLPCTNSPLAISFQAFYYFCFAEKKGWLPWDLLQCSS